MANEKTTAAPQRRRNMSFRAQSQAEAEAEAEAASQASKAATKGRKKRRTNLVRKAGPPGIGESGD